MILLGGLTTLHGPIIGALCYVGLLREFASLIVPERTLLVEGLVILAVVLALPQGLTGARFGWRRLRGLWSPVTDSAVSRERSAAGDG
jgi:ABC-type branched-subunit amino acid transport system permease subunit